MNSYLKKNVRNSQKTLFTIFLILLLLCVFCSLTIYIFYKDELYKPQISDIKNCETFEKNNYETYIINIKSRKYHKETCRYINCMNEENKEIFQGSTDELKNKCFKPCKNCNP